MDPAVEVLPSVFQFSGERERTQTQFVHIYTVFLSIKVISCDESSRLLYDI